MDATSMICQAANDQEQGSVTSPVLDEPNSFYWNYRLVVALPRSHASSA